MHGTLEMFEGHTSANTNTLLDDKAITSGWQAFKQVNRAFRDKVSAAQQKVGRVVRPSLLSVTVLRFLSRAGTVDARQLELCRVGKRVLSLEALVSLVIDEVHLPCSVGCSLSIDDVQQYCERLCRVYRPVCFWFENTT